MGSEGFRVAWAAVWLAAGGWLCASSPAVAQPLPTADPESATEPEVTTTHLVTLRGATPGAIWEIYPPEGPIDDQRPLARCGDRGCTLKMRSGTYRLWVESAVGGGPTGYRELRVHTDLDLTVRAPSRAARGGGLALAIVGKVAFVTGLTLTTLGAAGVCDCPIDELDCECPTDARMLSAGLVTMITGAVAIPAGWITFARHRHPRVEYNEPVRSMPPDAPVPEGPASAPAPVTMERVRLGPVQLGTGWGLGGRVTF